MIYNTRYQFSTEIVHIQAFRSYKNYFHTYAEKKTLTSRQHHMQNKVKPLHENNTKTLNLHSYLA